MTYVWCSVCGKSIDRGSRCPECVGKRFCIVDRWDPDAPLRDWERDPASDISFFLLDTKTNEIVGSDPDLVNCPEDAMLVRDLRWVVFLANTLADHITELEKQLEACQ